MFRSCLCFVLISATLISSGRAASAKTHTVTLGPARKVPYTPPEATADNQVGRINEPASTAAFRRRKTKGMDNWRCARRHGPHLRYPSRISHQRRASGRSTPLDMATLARGFPSTAHPGMWPLCTYLHTIRRFRDVVWFRDYAAYCGILTTAKGGLVAVVAELGVRKAVAQQKIGAWPQPDSPRPACSNAKVAAHAHARNNPTHERSRNHVRCWSVQVR